MGLFKKKKTSGDVSISSSNVSSKFGVGRRKSNVSTDLEGKVNQTAHEILVPLDFESLDESQQIDGFSTDSSRSSTGLKLRLRRSLSTLFLDKSASKSSPRISNEALEKLPRSTPPLPASEVCLQSPALKPSEYEHVDGTIEQQGLPGMELFTLPSDAPPVPQSPSPEQLAFLESNKFRLSALYDSVEEHDLTSDEADTPPLFQDRETQLTLRNQDFVHSIPSTASSSRPSGPSLAIVSSRDTSESASVEYRHRRTSNPSLPSGSPWSGDDLSTETTSIWSNAVARNSLLNDDSSNDSGSDSKEEKLGSESPSPEINLKGHPERIIANARLCDVLRTLFGSNGRVGITPQCKEHLSKAKEPRLLEISIGLRTPTLASYADDYTHGKFYVTCLDRTMIVDIQTLEFPLEGISSGKTSFSKLDYPDNFFDVVVSGSIQFMLSKSEWPDVLSECYRVLKPGGWIDMLTSSASFQSAGPVTKSYESQLLSCLEERNFYPNPGTILPSILRKVGFTEITRTQLTLPTFWRDVNENNNVCIRNARTGEEAYMTMSEIGDRVSTLMYGFWEEIFCDWHHDVEDLTERNRIRRKEAENVRTWSLIAKIGARKKGKLKKDREGKQRQKVANRL